MKKWSIVSALLFLIIAFSMCNKADVFSDEGYDDRLSGGLATVFDETSKAFTHSVSGLSERDQLVHEIGDKAFEQTFVAAGSNVFGGLGPVFNNVSCISCHHNDGKGTPTAGNPLLLYYSASASLAGCSWRPVGTTRLWLAITRPGFVWNTTGSTHANFI